MNPSAPAAVRPLDERADLGGGFLHAVGKLPSISLPELIERAELQHRIDHKFVVSKELFVSWIEKLAPEVRALEIDGRRSFGYQSIYFDTPDLLTFRQHRQGRRRRYKIRTRTYTDSADCTFEVKLEGQRGATIKERRPHPLEHRAQLTGSALQQLTEVLGGHAIPVPEILEPAQELFYHRSTLFLPGAPVRITCDIDLSYRAGAERAEGPREHVIVEVKSSRPRNAATSSLRSLGARPVQISKYCVGTALLTGASANRWQPVIKRYFRTSR